MGRKQTAYDVMVRHILVKSDPGLIRYCIGKGIMRYCEKCADIGNGCETCKVYDFGVFYGINDPLYEEGNHEGN